MSYIGLIPTSLFQPTLPPGVELLAISGVEAEGMQIEEVNIERHLSEGRERDVSLHLPVPHPVNPI